MPNVYRIAGLDREPMAATEIARRLEAGDAQLDRYLADDIYVNSDPDYLARQRKRLAETARLHAERVGDKPTWLLRAPGRLNAFLEYLDMCAGDHMSTTIDGDVPLAVSVREDDVLDVANSSPLFHPHRVSISNEFRKFKGASWEKHAAEMEDNWDNRSFVHPHYGRPDGSWLNYVLSPYLRAVWDNPSRTLRGADLTFGPATAPFRAGTSSSSAIVVLSFLAMCLCNRGLVPDWSVQEACKLLGEAEWYVGTHGGANDQTTILRNPPNYVLYNRHSKPELDSTPLPFLRGIHVVLANSLWEVNKALGGNQSFNMRKGWMQMGDEIMTLIIAAVREAQRRAAGTLDPADSTDSRMQPFRQHSVTGDGWLAALVQDRFGFTPGRSLPMLESQPELWDAIERNYHKFGSLVQDILGIPDEAIDELIHLLPIKITPEEAAGILGKDTEVIERVYTKPRRDIGGYHLRTTARFFHRENVIGRTLESIFLEAERRVSSDELSIDSAEYDQYRVRVGQMVDVLQDALCFDFRVSVPQIDLLLTIARRGPGYLGGKLTGAGKGGCVSILVREDKSAEMCDYLDREYYSKPEHFEVYRQVLDDERRSNRQGTPGYESAIERMQILESALASIPEQRRVITFSRGACAIEMG